MVAVVSLVWRLQRLESGLSGEDGVGVQSRVAGESACAIAAVPATSVSAETVPNRIRRSVTTSVVTHVRIPRFLPSAKHLQFMK